MRTNCSIEFFPWQIDEEGTGEETIGSADFGSRKKYEEEIDGLSETNLQQVQGSDRDA